ncbi:abnormal spindle-like microcephaly-associated protein isoform X1 [Oncorhynchus mykiss]|uniref:Assembly factor for spindle microtubules n=1 Tax=Oncorhynchus mykiss TaxID=8022 RepID=A0A8K9Y0V6_ONCMY|nr:abnormal spindle-like microcephaly-associated protein isoform X1 [Oncorhynchus mykiss]
MAQLSARGGFLDFSPIKKEDSPAVSYGNKENNSSHPVLSLIQFSRAPFVTFGNVKVGSSKSSVLCIENPVEDANIEVAIDKIASTKGFSVDQTRFTIPPEERVNLTITWTPIEEGGIRELITFIANGVVKHQAILLGRADAPKRRKKSLWDSIKSKKAFDLSDPPRGKKNSVSSLKMAANKTFHVSRTPQYRREKVRSPLASLNKKACTPVEGQKFKQDVLGQLSFDNVQKNSPVVILVPAAKLIDSSDAAASYSCPVGTPECRDLTRLLNTTVSPVGTPERFQKLMPHIQSIQSPVHVIDDTVADISHTVLAGTPVLSVRDALALIESDLTHVVSASPPNACSSFDFSHSLESANGEKNCGPVKSVIDIKALSESPIKSDPAQPRLTFFIKPKRVTDKEGKVEVGEVVPQSKKVTFTSTTVIKSKPVPVQVHSPGVRRIKTSRRRLLEKTLELSGDSGHSESSPGTTVTPGLPVIDSDANNDSPLTISPRLQALESVSCRPVCLDAISAPVNLSLSSPLPMNPSTGGPQHLGLDDSILGATQLHTAPIVESLPDRAGVFPVYNQSQFDMRVVRSKKRKSDEFLRDGGEKVEDAAEKTMFHVKKSRVSTVVKGPNRPAQQKGFSASSHRQQTKTSASVRTSSASSMKAPKSVSPAQAKQPAPKPGPQGAQKSFGGSSVKTAKIVAVAQSKLAFTKPGQTAIPRHPMPFAAKNMFYDERWIEKQETGFTWWINYVLTPDDFKVNTEVTKVNAVSLAMGGNDKFAVNKAPTKEEMSFSTYTARRRLNRLRRSACQLFTSEPMVKAIQRLELEVEARRLLVRKDRHLWKDIGERQKVLNWLLSYNPLWLRIGLETIYGEMISLESNSDVMGLAMFILKRLLWNPDIAAEFRHAKVPNLYKDGHEGALSRFTLKKLLLLVCFLDKAKESRMIEHDPCLFCMDAEFKTTKDLLLAFSRDFLSGEGILPRHLGYMGLPVSHIQTPLDEFNFAVKNLSVDLKCGIRLVRVMELFIQDWSLSRKLRMPAISRLQKVHNVDIALQVLRARGVDLKDEHDAVIDSRDIVDGHREKTLSLLWKIIFAFQVEVLLDEDQLREEISFLKHTWTTKQRLASLRADKGVLQKTAKPRPPFKHSSSKITLLMEWVNAVCQFYHLKAENFTVSFSDGRILCYLIHHYHPSHLPADSVSHNTTQTVECSQRGRVELNSSSSDSDISFDTWPTTQNGLVLPSIEFKELLENEKNNFRLVNTAVSDLGGVPAMMNPADMSNTIPNEKVVTCYLSFLCARLLDLRNETRAARIIQGAWRKYRLKKDLKLYQERTVAAGKIQVLVRQFLQRRRAVCQTAAAVRIQAAWRGYSARNTLTLRRKALLWALQVAAATTIQAQWKKYITLKNYQRLRLHVVKVQALWRMKMAVTTYRRTQWAATVIQEHVRASALAREERECYCSLRSAAIKIQRNYRRRKTRRLQRENHAATVIQTAFKKWHSDKMARRTAAALKIQSCYRMHRCLKQYMGTQRSAILIQAWCRGHAQRRNFETLKLQHHSATVIQSAFRASTVRKQMATMRQSSVVIQRWFRASVQRDAGRQQFLKMRCAAVTIQSAYRGHTARRLMQQQNQAATVIQTTFMKFVARRKFLSLKKSAIVVQQRFRAKLVGEKSRKEYMALQYSALRIQAIWRGRAERKRLEKLQKCATLIQSSYRRHVLQSQFRSRKEAAWTIQSQYRAYRAGKTIRTDYLLVKKAAVTVQARFRGMRVRQELRQKHQAATFLQSVVRVILCRRRYVLLQRAAVVLQCRYRALVASRTQRAQYSQLKLATVKLQSAYRGSRVRRDLRTKHQAATVIQAQLRMHKVRQAYLATKVAAIIVQQHYRANRLRDLQMQWYTLVKSAAVVIQAVYRGHRARMEVARMHHSAMIIQRRFLTFRDRKRFLAVKTAVLLCQQRCRDVAMVRKDQRAYLLKLRSVTALQAAFRGMKVRKQLQTECRAAILIQSHVRKHLQRAHYKRLQWAVNTVQARYRANKKMMEDRKALCIKRRAVVVLQAAFRGMLSRQRMREMHKAASVLQRSYRAHFERRQYLSLRSSVLAIQQKYRAAVAVKQQMRHYQRMRSAAILLQAAYRGQRARKEISLQHQAATTIQAGFRKHREEVKFQAMKFAAIIIQRYFRSHIQRKQDRDQFLTLKNSAIVLQAAFRGRCVRRDVAKLKRAASVIQANFRMHKEQVKFQAMRLSAVIIQRHYRSHIQMKRDRDRFIKIRESAFVLQAAFRAYHIRQDAAKMHRAASVIQANFRMHKEQVKFQAMRLSAVIIQRHYRSHIQMKRDRDRFIKIRESAIVLQEAFREMTARKQLQTECRASILIQSHVRKHLQRAHYKRLQWAVNTVQARYRANKKMMEDRKALCIKRRAVVVLQAAFRGMLSRQRMREMHKAASVLQRSYRAHFERRQYLSLRSSVLAIQQKYRAAVAVKQQMRHYQRMRSAAILLQAAYRGQRARKEISLQHQAATTIQAGFRKHREEVKFQAMKFAAIIIQRYFRSHIQRKQDRDQFLTLKNSAIVLQAAFRGRCVRHDVAKMKRAASVIQANFRMHKEQVKFQAMRFAAIIIQRYFRCYIQMKQDRDRLKKCRESAIVLQAAYRGYRVRQDVAKMCRAATVIQANFRMHKEQSAYRRQHWAASVLQQRFRAQRLRNSQLENYHQMRNAVINLQALYRGKRAMELAKRMMAARKIQSFLRMSIRRQRFLKEKAAALLIQSAFRRHQAKTRYNETQASAVTIQRWYRSCNVLRRQRDDYLAIREAAVKLQSAIRGTLARRLARRKRAAVKIQSVIRMSIQRRSYLTLRSSTVKLQSHCRAWVARRRFLKRRTAAATLQKHYRGRQAQREQRSLYLKTLTSVKMLQTRVRGHIQLKRYQNLKRSAVTIQAFYRGMVERRRFQNQRASAAIIQERFRAYLLCRRERAKYLEMKQSAVLIQAVFRGDLARQSAKKRQAAVATVHRCMQTRHLRNRFLVLQCSVRVIQGRWRETLKAREERRNFLVMKAAAVTIEASWRGHATRNRLHKEQRAAVLVQSSFRGRVQKRAFQRQREAALVLQRRVRAMQQAKAERVKYTRLKQATITVQAHCRGWIARRQLREAASAERRVRFCTAVYHHLCAVRIQRALRSHLALQSAKRQITSVIFIQRWLRARLQRRRYLEDRRRVVVAQRAARSWLARRRRAASTIQHAARTFLLRRREQRVQQGIIKAQALWRGHQSRKLHDNCKVVSMRHRLRKVSEEVREEDRLCNKTSWAIEYLLKYKHFSYILEALKNLETATRLSPECCERLVTSGATLVIFTLIRSCNRSVPSMEVITYAIQVLLNLSKYDKTIEAVYAVENSVDTLLDLLQIYREKAGDKVADKGGSIFTKACFLLIILLQDQYRALEVRKLSKAVDRLRSIYRLTARKHKMDAERTVVKQKMGASINGSFIVPATPRKSKPVPKFSPDWVLRKDKLQDIVDPLRAVQMVADVFSIVL